MKATARMLALLVLAAAGPALGAWEELRRNDHIRLSIDPKTIRTRGAEISFKYLVDYRALQGDFKTTQYRSLVVRAAVRCKAKTFSQREIEAFAANEAKGPSMGARKATPEESRFTKVELGTSDEDLLQRVCKPPKASAKVPANK